MTNDSGSSPEHVPSPCVHICYLDDNDICQGCYRSADEITDWQRMTNEERCQVLVNVAQREQQSPWVNQPPFLLIKK